MNAKPVLTFLLIAIVFSLQAQNATEIVRRAEEHARGITSIFEITIQTVRPNWTREMSAKAWTKGNDYALLLVTAPAKEKGVVFLKRDKEVWNYLPAIERNIKMPPSMMSQSWMGTDFTNDDLVKEASILEDYDHFLAGDTVINGRACHKITMFPKPTAAVVWGRVNLSIDKRDDLMLHADYFDEDGTLINTMHTGDIKVLGGRMLPARLEMIPMDKKGHKTIMVYTSVTFDLPLEETFFSVQNMARIK
jgi:outer membrane lipoprotein-sorting protein